MMDPKVTDPSWTQALAQRARAVDEAIDSLLPPKSVYPSVIHEAMRYSALGGGKRLRGVLVVEAALLMGAQDSFRPGPAVENPRLTHELMSRVGAVRAAAAAIEMVHAYSLIHDDLPGMDDDDVRRGKPTNHRVYGEGMAILAGDALLTRAFEVLGRLPWAGVSESIAVAIVGELAAAAGTGGLIGGQVADLQSEGSMSDNSQGHEDLLKYIHSRKTGALFRVALRIGGLVAGAGDDALQRLETYADRFGMAFQIVDDLLDVEGDADALGKQVGSDVRKEKLTFPAVYGMNKARELAQEQIQLAKEALVPFTNRASFLENLADFVLTRQH